MKFKKGDKVEVVKLTEDSQVVRVGDTGVVKSFDYNDKFPIKVNINDELDYGFKSEELELIVNDESIETNNKIPKIPNYPEDFFDFSKGVDILNNTINDWIKRCIDNINNSNINKTHSCISSGNTKVIVLKNDDRYEVNVIKDYKEFENYFDEQ